MPEEGVALSPEGNLLTQQELCRLVTVFAGFGVEKVRLTGGEPLVRRDLEDIVGETIISLTTGAGCNSPLNCSHDDWYPRDTECPDDHQWCDVVTATAPA